MTFLTQPIKANVRVRIDNTNKLYDLPSVFVLGEGYLGSYLRYIVKNRLKSKSWKDKSIQAIILLIEFTYANKGCFDTKQKMFEEFTNSLHSGTINWDGNDDSGLRWTPLSTENANALKGHITRFSDYLFDETGNESALLNPLRTATGAEKIVNLAAFHHKKNKVFLSHIFDSKQNNDLNTSRNVRNRKVYQTPSVDQSVSFPEEHIDDLLWNGFVKPVSTHLSPIHKRYKLAPLLITMLMHYGGIRRCEAFHLYAEDVQLDPLGRVVIRIYHPIKGMAPEYYRNQSGDKMATRIEYLNKKYGLEDRKSSTRKTYHAGWKEPALADSKAKFFYVYFAPTEKGILFYQLFKQYMLHQRKVNKLGGQDAEYTAEAHPFLFTNNNGDPLSIASFDDHHKRAVEAIGLEEYRANGTSGHCHRHAFKKRLEKLNVSAVLRQDLMHHRNIYSQNGYGKATNQEIYDCLSDKKALSKSEIALFTNLEANNNQRLEK
jgi:hypothetical protein